MLLLLLLVGVSTQAFLLWEAVRKERVTVSTTTSSADVSL
jgi:hypothetical protein